MSREKELAALSRIEARMKERNGHLGFYYKNLVTGLTFGCREEDAFLAASVIKLPLFLHILTRAHEGTLDMTDTIRVTDDKKVPVCGAVTLFTGEPEVDIWTLCRLMISLSDNTATNLLLDYCTIEDVTAGFRAMGLETTCVQRRLFDAEASAQGKQNRICPREMGDLLERLYRKTFVSEDVSQAAIDTLFLQQINHKLDGKLCGAVPIAHKTGEDDELSNDVGIVYAPQPFVICFAGHDTDVYPWETIIREGTYDLVMAQND